MGGLLGIDVTSQRHPELESKEETPTRVTRKIQVLKREEISIWVAGSGALAANAPTRPAFPPPAPGGDDSHDQD